MIYSFEPFGYEGSMVSVETDLRDGISAMDIIGIADSLVSESRERVRSAFTNSAIPLPEKRILIALSPADLLKRNPHDLAIAMSILSHDHGFIDESILILGGIGT